MTTAGGQGGNDFETSSAIIPTNPKHSATTTSSSSQEAEHIYTFYDDIKYIPDIHEIAASAQNVVQNTIANMKKFLLKFRDFKHLWRSDKVNIEFELETIQYIFYCSSYRLSRNSLQNIHR